MQSQPSSQPPFFSNELQAQANPFLFPPSDPSQSQSHSPCPQQFQQQQDQDHYQLLLPSLTSQSSQFSQPPILAYSYSGISNASSTPQFVMHSSRMSQQPIPHFAFIRAQKLYSSIQKMVAEVKEVVLLDEDIVEYLLYGFKWDKVRVFQEWEKCCERYRERNGMLRKGKGKDAKEGDMEAKGEKGEKGICHICENEGILHRNLLCQHTYCNQCWRGYIKQKLNQNCIFFSCMDRCQNSGVLLHGFVQKLFPEFYQQYRKIICINYANVNKSISYCPSQKKPCDLFCQRSQCQYDVTVECLCGQFYCFFCRKQPHHPATCEDVQKWEKLLNNQQSSSEWIAKNTKTCPFCKNSVEKYIGCSKIKCVCGAQFCYQCNAKWDSNHKSNKGECMSLSRKSSLQQRSQTSDFLKVHQKSLQISRTLKKNMASISSIFQHLHQQWIMSKFHDVRKQILDSLLALKWGIIVLFIYKKPQIEQFIQKSFIQAIYSLMECIEKLGIQNGTGLIGLNCPKDIMAVGEQANRRRESLRKCRDDWFEAWRNVV